MHKSVYRPPSVWVTQILVMLTLINSGVALISTLFRCPSAEPPFNCSSPSVINALLSGCLVLAITCLAFWGLQKRKRYGKWLAVSFLVGGMVIVIVESPLFQLIYYSITQWQPLPAPPYECWKKSSSVSMISYPCGYNSYGELIVRLISESVPALLLGFLAVRLLYSDASKRFFQA